MEGFGTYQYVDGRAEVGRYQGNVDVGEGVRWSSDRQTAWRLQDGRRVGRPLGGRVVACG